MAEHVETLSATGAASQRHPDAATERSATGVRELGHWIGGTYVVAEDPARHEVSSPVTGRPVTRVAEAAIREINLALSAAQEARRTWAALAAPARGRILLRLAERLRARSDEYVDVECEETGKIRGEMQVSLEDAAGYFELYGGAVRGHFGDTIDLGGEQHAFSERVPYGVTALITPWNGPLTQVSRGLSAALAAGNTAVVKPSEFTSSTALMLAEDACEVGLPAGVFNVLTGSGSGVGAPLLADPRVRKISFTGSIATGRLVARLAAERFVSTTLELGGKSPLIVFADADLDRAVDNALTITRGAGQVCAALSRLLIEEPVYEAMIERVAQRLESLRLGRDVAPLTTPAQFEKVKAYLDVGRQEGARLVAGGRAADDGELARGRYVHPTLFADVTPSMRVFQEEIFGPVLTVTPFRDELEAIALANGTEYGLVASVWTRDGARGLRVARDLECGQVTLNGGRTGVDTPFGGFKSSGQGREKGIEALRDYTQAKTTVVSLS